MTKIAALFPGILLLSGSFSAHAWADSNIGVHGSIAFPVAGAAPAMIDRFNYVMTGRPPFYSNSPVPDPWDFAALGGSTNSLLYDYGSLALNGGSLNKVLGVTYSGSGWYVLSREDLGAVNGTYATYQIDFQDDGTRDLGELFYVEDAAWHFVGVGVNNRVVKDYYYFRNDRDPEMPIYVRRDGKHANGDWHTFKLYVSPWGSYGSVDDVYAANSWYPNLNTVTDVNLKGDWKKPVNTVLVDNFVVTPWSGIAPGTVLNGPENTGDPSKGGPGRIYNPYGDAELLTMGTSDFSALLASDSGRWQAANPLRANVVSTALREASYGLCDDAALSRYDASGEWCSEFARWVYDNSPGATNSYIHDWLSALDATEDVVTTFQDYNCGQPTGPGYTPRAYMTPDTPKPGDYLAQVSGSTGKRNGHSSIVIGVSADSRYIWTVEGNINTGPNTPHCVHLGYRDFYVNGVLNPDLDGVGNAAALYDTPHCPKY